MLLLVAGLVLDRDAHLTGWRVIPGGVHDDQLEQVLTRRQRIYVPITQHAVGHGLVVVVGVVPFISHRQALELEFIIAKVLNIGRAPDLDTAS